MDRINRQVRDQNQGSSTKTTSKTDVTKWPHNLAFYADFEKAPNGAASYAEYLYMRAKNDKTKHDAPSTSTSNIVTDQNREKKKKRSRAVIEPEIALPNQCNHDLPSTSAKKAKKTLDEPQPAGGGDLRTFKEKVIEVIGKPFDQDEHDKLHEMILNEKNLDCDPVLGRQLTIYRHNKGKYVNILRGYFFWLENRMQEGSFHPWRNHYCLAVDPPFTNLKADKCIKVEENNSENESDTEVEILDAATYLKEGAFEPSKRYDKSIMEEDFQIFGAPNAEDEYREKVLDVIGKPFDKKEYGRLSKTVKSGKYLDHYPDLKEILVKYRYNKGKRLNILRGYFFWVQNVTHQGIFKPWTDEACLAVDPPFL